ncbi:MAG TPA: START domain-containing protein [Puia sp.]|nr:START domain-containing protein [Puia sp.]
MKALLLHLICLSACLSLNAQSNWVLKKQKDGISIYSRSSEVSPFDDLKVEVDLKGTIDQLASILLDIPNYTQWAYGTKVSKIVQRTSKTELIYYTEIEVPWPASNRDLYASFKLTIDSSKNTMQLVATAIKDYLPPKDDLVRVPTSKGKWLATKLSPHSIHLEYTLQLDPGGSVPAWVLNLFSTKGPLETFENLRKKMEEMNK